MPDPTFFRLSDHKMTNITVLTNPPIPAPKTLYMQQLLLIVISVARGCSLTMFKDPANMYT